VIRNGTPAVFETAVDDSAPEVDTGISSVVTVPIKIRGDVLGTVTVGSASSERRHTSNDKYLLSVLADYVAVGVENSRLFGRAQRKAEELALLNEVGQAISSTLDLEQALTLVMERVNSMLRVEAGSLMLVDEEAGELVFQIALGQKSDQIKPLRLKIGKGIAGRVAESGQAALILDARRDTGQGTAIDISTDFLARSILCVPMKARGVTIGVIEVINKVDGVFTEDDRNVLSSIANYAAVAIDNARLFRTFQSESSGRSGTVR
jgi:GAF domain-containing protein